MPPVVSVIMPTFNRLEFLAPAVDSLFAQTLTDWELIVADDGSDAATWAITPGRVRKVVQRLRRRRRVQVQPHA